MIAASLAAVLLVPHSARAQDADGDGVLDAADVAPFDARVASVTEFPGDGSSALIGFEDQWPEVTDLDFNDVVVRVHHRFERRADGHVARLWLTLDPVAAGGDYRTGLGLQLPASKAGLIVRRRSAGGAWSELSLQPDPQATVRLVDDVRSLFGGASGRTNVDPALSAIAGDRLEVEFTWAVPVSLSVAQAPFDLFIFRTQTPSHEIHFPQYPGTLNMNLNLFGSLLDASTATRKFVMSGGLPASLNLMTASTFPAEGVQVSSLFPSIVQFASSAGAQAADFYLFPNLAASRVSPPPPAARSAPPAISAVEACAIANGSGLRVRAGSLAGPCAAASCAAGHALSDGACVAVPSSSSPGRLCVADQMQNRVSAFAPAAAGDVAPSFSFGDETGIGVVQAIRVAPGPDEMIVLDSSQELLFFDRGAGGNTPPKRRITLPAASGARLAYDPVNDEVWVSMGGSGNTLSLLAYARTAQGAAAPVRSFTATMNALDGDLGDALAFDPIRQEVLVAGHQRFVGGWVFAFPRGSTGTTPPSRAFRDAVGAFDSQRLTAMDVDATTGETYVGAPSSGVHVYAAGATGAVEPLRTIYSDPLPYYGALAYDPVNEEAVFVVSGSGSAALAIVSGAGGTAVTLGGGVDPVFDNPTGVAVDGGRGEVFGIDTKPGIRAFLRADALAEGNVAVSPVRTLGGPGAGVYYPTHMVTDAARGEVYVLSQVIRSVSVFAVGSASASPVRTFSHPQLGGATRLALDLVNDELYVAGLGTVQVFARTATGAATPLRATGWSALSVAVDPVRDVVYLGDPNHVSEVPRLGGAPLRTWVGFEAQALESPSSIAFDAAHQELFVHVGDPFVGGLGPTFVKVYSTLPGAPATPVRTITSASLNASVVSSLAFDPGTGLLALAGRTSSSSPAVWLFDRTADSNTPPLRSIGGSATNLGVIGALAFCP